LSVCQKLNHVSSMITYCPPQRHLADSRFEEDSSGCQTSTSFQLKVVFDEFT